MRLLIVSGRTLSKAAMATCGRPPRSGPGRHRTPPLSARAPVPSTACRSRPAACPARAAPGRTPVPPARSAATADPPADRTPPARAARRPSRRKHRRTGGSPRRPRAPPGPCSAAPPSRWSSAAAAWPPAVPVRLRWAHLIGQPLRPPVLISLRRRSRPVHLADLGPVVLDRPTRPGVPDEQRWIDLHERPEIADRRGRDLFGIGPPTLGQGLAEFGTLARFAVNQDVAQGTNWCDEFTQGHLQSLSTRGGGIPRRRRGRRILRPGRSGLPGGGSSEQMR